MILMLVMKIMVVFINNNNSNNIGFPVQFRTQCMQQYRQVIQFHTQCMITYKQVIRFNGQGNQNHQSAFKFAIVQPKWPIGIHNRFRATTFANRHSISYIVQPSSPLKPPRATLEHSISPQGIQLYNLCIQFSTCNLFNLLLYSFSCLYILFPLNELILVLKGEGSFIH